MLKWMSLLLTKVEVLAFDKVGSVSVCSWKRWKFWVLSCQWWRCLSVWSPHRLKFQCLLLTKLVVPVFLGGSVSVCSWLMWRCRCRWKWWCVLPTTMEVLVFASEMGWKCVCLLLTKAEVSIFSPGKGGQVDVCSWLRQRCQCFFLTKLEVSVFAHDKNGGVGVCSGQRQKC